MDVKNLFFNSTNEYRLNKSVEYATDGYFKSRLYVVDTMIRELQLEKKTLLAMIEHNAKDLCPVCNGEGTTRARDECGDTSWVRDCNKCNGSGLK